MQDGSASVHAPAQPCYLDVMMMQSKKKSRFFVKNTVGWFF
jgi:hypothetical protein